MSLTLSRQVLACTTTEELSETRAYFASARGDDPVDVQVLKLSASALNDVHEAAQRCADRKTERAVKSILAARAGDFKRAVPSFNACLGVVDSFLRQSLIDGWIYVEGDDSLLYPELVTDIAFDDGKHYRGTTQPCVRITTACIGVSDLHDNTKYAMSRRVHTIWPQTIANRRVADALRELGIHKESPELKTRFEASQHRHAACTRTAFAEKFRVNGAAMKYERDNYHRRGQTLDSRKVIHDLEATDYGSPVTHVESVLFDHCEESPGLGSVPAHPIVRVFDLARHEYYWVHGDNMTAHHYDSSLREKLILPQSHRDLLDVLTTNLDAFVGDFIEGKSAGNVVLCKGPPGVGKTLTAEVYAELIHRPLYAVHSGNLGTTADVIQAKLESIFSLARRWRCVLLLDEADVFVMRRGVSVEQNAIVAEFLRTLEYFDGLLFMTTNRPDDIDDAFISRCAAVIDYDAPSKEDAARIWQVMSIQFDSPISDALRASLLELFPKIAPRDIKMLFRLALRYARTRGEALTIETFRTCAMFRAIAMKEVAGTCNSP